LAPPAAAGHFDELRGVAAPAPDAPRVAGAHTPLTPHWARFFENLGREGFNDLNRRTVNLERQVRDNGVTYNVYADADGPQRPWSLDLFPLIISPESWRQIETGVIQRTRLLDRVMADVYGPQRLLADGLLPSALVQGHPGYLRAMHGAPPVGVRTCTLRHLTWHTGLTATGGWCRSARRRRQAWATCLKTASSRRACSPRPFATCTCSASQPATARWWTACAR